MASAPCDTVRNAEAILRRGFALVEVLLVILILALMATLVPAGGHLGELRTPLDPRLVAIDSARGVALVRGRAVLVAISSNNGTTYVRALPDGRLIGAERFGYDGITGRRVVDAGNTPTTTSERYRVP